MKSKLAWKNWSVTSLSVLQPRSVRMMGRTAAMTERSPAKTRLIGSRRFCEGASRVYGESGKNVTLNCGPGETLAFTVDDDGALNGPPGGMVSRLTKKK